MNVRAAAAGVKAFSSAAGRAPLPPSLKSPETMEPGATTNMTQEPLGLIAGEGVFPLLVARGARAAGRKVVCAAFSGIAWPDLAAEVDRMRWVGLLRFNQWIRVLRAEGCTEAVMVGRVAKSQMYDRW